MASSFVPGWTPALAQLGRQRFASAGRTFFGGAQFQDDTRPLPSAYSLSGLLLATYDQGQVGSCFSNMGAYVLQLMMASLAASGYTGKQPFNPSRRLIWYQCRKLDGTLGDWQDGGSIVNSFAALGDQPHGVGDCSEELWPYQPSHTWLERTPPPTVLQAAGSTRVTHIAELPYDQTAWKRSIYNGKPVGIGIFWPEGWDDATDQYGRTTGVGPGEWGHAVTVIGWVDGWDGHDWLEIINSHGPIYGVPPADVVSRTTGFKPTRFSFFARADHLAQVVGMPNTECYNAAGVEGFTKQVLNAVLV